MSQGLKLDDFTIMFMCVSSWVNTSMCIMHLCTISAIISLEFTRPVSHWVIRCWLKYNRQLHGLDYRDSSPADKDTFLKEIVPLMIQI